MWGVERREVSGVRWAAEKKQVSHRFFLFITARDQCKLQLLSDTYKSVSILHTDTNELRALDKKIGWKRGEKN